MSKTKNYRPLPDSLCLASSSIEGVGVFARKRLERGVNLGMTHLRFGSDIIRTPLGGFLNHSDNPNCEKATLRFTNQDDPKLKYDFKKWNLITIKDIKAGEELTVKYEWYKV